MIEKYRVSGKREVVAMITEALEACGVEVLQHPSVNEAPFPYTIKLRDGKRVELLCYAFYANKYEQAGRPPDEHRFQVKYGGEFDRPHDIYIDPKREVITLFIGVHLNARVFIGADPAMHTPTWFSSSIEFKTHHVDAAKADGSVAWERPRSAGRRRAGKKLDENAQTETLIAFEPDRLLRYIEFERIATGLDAGERLLLAEKMLSGPAEKDPRHPAEIQFGLSPREILDVIWGRARLAVAVRGGVAEHHLRGYLRRQPGITSVQELDLDGQPDFEIVYDARTVRIECKNVLRLSRYRGKPRVDFQKTRASKDNACSRYYDPASFDVLAACMHPITERWEFQFASTATLDAHKTCPGKLSPNVVVDGDRWSGDLRGLLNSQK